MPKDEKKPAALSFEEVLRLAGAKPDKEAGQKPQGKKFEPKDSIEMPDGDDSLLG